MSFKRSLTTTRKYSVYEAPLETWLSILRLANRWSFDSVKELSVRELEKIEIEAVEKISIYHENNISRLYLIPSYVAVCKRDQSLSFTEGMRLGMETVLRIAEAREKMRLRASESGIRSPTFEDFEDEEVETLIREIFSLGSRPTSPTHVTSPSTGVNGSQNDTFKLKPAPTGNLLRANGATTSRPNGGSVADARGSSVDSLPSFVSAMSSSTQEPVTSTTTATTATTTTQATAPQATAQQELRAPAPPAKTTTQAASTRPAPAPVSTTDQPEGSKGQETGSGPSLFSPKSGGAGEPSSSASCSVVLS